ncbi:GNAT family N-acetyltransferase [Paenarthrobacter sp. NPDC089316]|uniref:GNAT family N-acetyltransferase n=1 Tax=unclassified Paenarthrobacter TaxID=2634190 RepID=UPI00343B5AB5
MCPEATGELFVALADVDESVLEELLAVALVQASADEVTPPLGSTPSWNPERIAWFRAYHRAAAAGLDGPAREKTWAVVAGGTVMGSVRLKSFGSDAAETGIWLATRFRSQGVGRLALQLVADEARARGFAVLEACTAPGNKAAQALLSSLGAELIFEGTLVKAQLLLR